MHKSPKVSEPTPLVKQPEMEFLVSHDPTNKPPSAGIAARTKLYIGLFLAGLVGSLGCFWIMIDARSSKEKIESLGLHKVANASESVLALLAYPVLLLSLILMSYAAQRLFFMYRAVNDPETYRKRRERVAIERRSGSLM